jgi:FtsP/CotA-like multicopper oxidase with cupredoxin domain
MKNKCLLITLWLAASVAGAQVPLQPGCSMPVMTPNGKPDYMSGCVGNYANSPLPRVSGGVTGLMLLTGGIGYSNNPVVTIDPPGGVGTAAHAVANVYNGSIVGFTITAPGSGYTFVPNVMLMDATGRDASASAVMSVVQGTGMRKFVDTLPGLCSVSGLNNLQQCIPIATPDTVTFGATNDFYRIGVRDYSRKLHSDLPATKLRGYVQLDSGNNPIGANQYLGPMILAQRNRPVRMLFKNLLATGPAGKLFLPVDTTYMGAGMGPDGTPYSQNRAVIHLHGGNTPWISDGTPHQWITPAGEATNYKKGVSFNNVPDMIGTGKLIPNPSLADGLATYYFTNQQSGRLMWYHDHAYGLTRLNVYAGEVAPFLLYDPAQESALAAATVPGAITNSPDFAHLIPLVIQDKTFVPDATPSGQLNVQDPTWDVANWGGKGNLWFPHLYLPNQNPSDDTGANPMGRWDYGPWFWPPQDASTFAADGKPYACPTVPNPSQICPGTPTPSGVPEGFMDTPVVNGTAYPILHVAAAAYRFLILDGANDRYLNLSFYRAYDAATGQMCTGTPATPGAGSQAPSTCTEVKLIQSSDGIAGQGPVPDPTTAGPDMVQIGTEGGLLPGAVVIPPAPISYTYNRRDITVLNVAGHSLFLGPAERADVVVDFSAYAGKTLILYNDAPAPVPAFDSRNDYYTGAPGQTDTGGAPTPQPGYGPNTRTILQVVVDANAPNTVPFNLAVVSSAMPAIFASTQDLMIVPEQVYGAASNVYSRIEDTSLGFGPVGSLSLTNSGAGYGSTPTVTIASPGGTGRTATATATIDGRYIASVSLLNGGSGYSSVPTVSITGGGGSGATATATIAPISVASLTLTSGGTGYSSAPTVSFTGGGGTGAIATAKIGTTTLNSITVTNGGSNYTGTPTVTISGGGGTGATARATVANRRVSAITITSAGTGYTSAPSVVITNGGGSGATAMSTLKAATVTSVALSSGGTGYTSVPTVSFSGGGGTGAVATATLSNSAILNLTLTNRGAGYTSVPTVVFSGGGGTGATASAAYVPGFVSSLTLTDGGSGYAAPPSVTLSGGGGSGATATAATLSNPILAKTIQELFTLDYGRMNATLGVEIPFTNFTTQTTIPYGYVDPPTEIFKDGETQLWKITHNGVDTHAIHFHLFNVQVVNRVGWDGMIKPPESNELSWKDTVRMNPLEDVIVALRPAKMNVPFHVPNSIRYLDVTMPPDMTSATMFTNVDPTNQPAAVTNGLVNFGWEYVWHCHLLGHEENDMMRPMILAVAPDAPAQLAAAAGKGSVTLSWTNNAYNETGFTVQRASSGSGPWSNIATVTSSAGAGAPVSYVDRGVTSGTTYYYRVMANNVVGYGMSYAAPAVGYPQVSADSAPTSAVSAKP